MLSRSKEIFALLLVLGCVTTVYWRTLDFGILQEWDDKMYLIDRPDIFRFAKGENAALFRLLSPSQRKKNRDYAYYPVTDVSIALDARRGGMAASAFHQTNLVLFLMSMLLVYLLARAFHLPPMVGLVATALFGLHPLVVEPVAWISGRRYLLYLNFSLLALLWLKRILDVQMQGRLRLFLSFLLFFVLLVLALLSNSIAVSTILMALVLVWLFAPKALRFRYLLYLLPVLGLAMLLVFLQIQLSANSGGLRPNPDGSLGMWFRALGAPSRALTRFLAPVDLSPDYGEWAIPWWLDPQSWLSVGFLLLFLLSWRRISWSSSVTALGALIVLSVAIACLPTSGLVTLGQVHADRHLFFASVWLSIGAAWVAFVLFSKWPWAARVLLLALLLFAFQTHRYLPVWKQDHTIFQRIYEHDSSNFRANMFWGLKAYDARQFEKARFFFLKVQKKHPRFADAWMMMGIYWLDHYRDLVRRHPKRAQRAKQRAERNLLRAADLKPHSFRVWINLGALWHVTGDLNASEAVKAQAYAKAKQYYQKALIYHPRHAVVHANLGAILLQLGQYKQAERSFRHALTLPNAPLPMILSRFYLLLWKQRRFREASVLLQPYLHEPGRTAWIVTRLLQRYPPFLPTSKPQPSSIPTSRPSSQNTSPKPR